MAKSTAKAKKAGKSAGKRTASRTPVVSKRGARSVAVQAAKRVSPRRASRIAQPPVTPERGRGRPTDYRPEYCDEVIDFCRRTGKSLTAFAGSILTSRKVLNDWAKVHPEFRDAMETAKAARADLLESQVMVCTNGPAMNARLLALKNAAPEDWVDRTDHRVGGLPGAPPVATAQIDVTKVTPQMAYEYVINGSPFPVPQESADDNAA